MFIEKGIKCVVCGLRGSYYALERLVSHKVYQQYLKRDFDDFLQWEIEYRNSLPKKKSKNMPNINAYHFNLYAIDDNGDEILMTKDHIIPKSKGGRNHLSNYQPMCCVCNQKKDNKIK
jgi:5-methylcytosine-specific restriction endonuclease McrA